MKNKKGAIPSALADFVGYGAFVVVLLVFFLLFKLSVEAKTNEIKTSDFAELAAQQLLTNYLRTPVYIQGSETMAMADYIAVKYLQNNLDDSKKTIKEDLDKLVKEIGNEIGAACYVVQVLNAEKIVQQFNSDLDPAQTGCPSAFAAGSVSIPTDSSELLAIRLVIYYHGKKA